MGLASWKSPAARRYTLRVAGFMVVYVAILWIVGWTYHHGRMPDGVLRYLFAAAPALPVFGVIWAMQRFVQDETDEYIRMLRGRAHALAAGLTVAICTVLGFLEDYGGVAHLDMVFVFVIFVVALGPSQAWVNWRAGR